jgi:hypothetical protein
MKIVIDEFHLNTYPDAYIVKDDQSYLEARKQILDFKIKGTNSKLIAVTSHPYTFWFSDIEMESQISVDRVLPSKKLKERTKSISDSDLEEEDIVQLGLLNQTIEPTEISLVNKYIGSFLIEYQDLISQLYWISAYAANPPKHFLSSKYLHIKWLKYLNTIDSEIPVLQAAICRIKDRDTHFCKVFNELIYVSNSHILLNESIHDHKSYLETLLQRPIQELEKFLLESNFEAPINKQIELRIEGFFKTLYSKNNTLFFKEKGSYNASLIAFLSVTKTITQGEKEIILTKYKKFIDYELEEKINSLVKPEPLPPPQVDELSLTMQIDAWQNWAVNSFIPFKFYLDEVKDDKEILLAEKYANTYSDWLYNSYAAIVQSGIKTNYNVAGIISDHLDDYKVIWLIIDGFPAAYSKMLVSILRSYGINKVEESFHFAAVPTITSIGIPTQLSGRTPQSEFYTNDREEALKLAFYSKKVIFKNSVAAFQTALNSEYDVCCLHWKEIDEFMHKEDSDVEVQRSEEIKRLLNIRLKQVANVIKSNPDRRVKLIISVDHGITKCLTRGQNIKNSSLLESCKDNPKERCVELNGSLSKANINEDEVYYLKADQTLNKKDWAVAKGYRYFGRFDYGYRHGGLTPEETIVPFLSCEITQNEILPIKLAYGGLKEIQLGYTETFRIIIKNDNDVQVEIQKVTIAEDINFSIGQKEQILPTSSKSIEGRIKLSKATFVRDGKALLNVLVSYCLYGEMLTESVALQVPIKKSVNESLDNLFS